MTSLAIVFRALADPTRLGLFEQLAGATELSVKSLTAGTRVSQPAVSQHLAVLKAAGLVGERRSGRQVMYRAQVDALHPAIDWMGHHTRFWHERFDALERVLGDIDDREEAPVLSSRKDTGHDEP